MYYPHPFAPRRFLAVALLAVYGLIFTPAQAEGFLSAIDDMPLADGVVELPDGALVFDKPEGRIVQVTALREGASTPARIRAFYLDTLPNLGWRHDGQASGHLTFTRKGEILRITLTADLVIFDLAPGRSTSGR